MNARFHQKLFVCPYEVLTTMSIYAHEIQSAEAAASAALGEILESDLIKKAE